MTVSYPTKYVASATFTPAASSHTAGDANDGAKEFKSLGKPGELVMIVTSTFLINSATAEASAWRLYLFSETPPSALADLGDFLLAAVDQATFLGQVDLGTAVDLGSTQWVEVHGHNKPIRLVGTSAWGYLVNLTTVTPAAVAHTATLFTLPVLE